MRMAHPHLWVLAGALVAEHITMLQSQVRQRGLIIQQAEGAGACGPGLSKDIQAPAVWPAHLLPHQLMQIRQARRGCWCKQTPTVLQHHTISAISMAVNR